MHILRYKRKIVLRWIRIKFWWNRGENFENVPREQEENIWNIESKCILKLGYSDYKFWKKKIASKQGFRAAFQGKKITVDVQQNLTKVWIKLLWRNIRNYPEIQIKSYNFSLAAVTGLNCNLYVLNLFTPFKHKAK